MNLHEIFIRSIRNILFGLIAFALALPLLLSVPVVREYFINVISMIGIGN
jgi:hypothetical protein